MVALSYGIGATEERAAPAVHGDECGFRPITAHTQGVGTSDELARFGRRDEGRTLTRAMREAVPTAIVEEDEMDEPGRTPDGRPRQQRITGRIMLLVALAVFTALWVLFAPASAAGLM
jgi:hypothetical protein